MKRTKKLILMHIGIILALAVYVALVYFTPLQCPTKMIFSLPCPFCGLTRAWISVFSGDFSSAFAMHPLFPLAPVLIVLFAHRDALSEKKQRVCDLVMILLAVLFFVVFVIRMIIHGGKL